jgi:hypothetical protein
MRVSERDQLASILQRNGGRSDALLSVMRQQVAHGTREMGRPGASMQGSTGRSAMPAGGGIGSSMQGTMERPAAPQGEMGSSIPPRQSAVERPVAPPQDAGQGAVPQR